MEPRGKAGSALESSAPGTACVAMRKWQNAFPTFGSYDKYLNMSIGVLCIVCIV